MKIIEKTEQTEVILLEENIDLHRHSFCVITIYNIQTGSIKKKIAR